LILAGEKDQWHPVGSCRQYVAGLKLRQEITLRVFEDAHHGFDLVGLDMVESGYIVRYHPEAAAETIEMTRAFLECRL
jgi:dienelactone hydrolase